MFEIIKSVVILLLVSAAIALTCSEFLNTSFTGIFLLTTILQLVFGWFFKSYTQFVNQRDTAAQQSQLISQIEAEATAAPCAYCGHTNLIPIVPEGDNDFECTECGEHNSVYVNVTIAQKSVPIDAERYEVTNFNQNLQSAKEKILEHE